MITLIYNVVIVNRGTERRGAVIVDGSRVAAVVADAPEAALKEQFAPDRVIDGGGGWLMPGVIDTHVHFRDPGLTAKADFATESRAAATGGVTSVVDMPNTIPQTTTVERVRQKMERAAATSWVNYAFFIGVAADNADELLAADYTRVAGIKLFLGSTTGDMMVDDDTAIRRILSAAPCPVVVHAESEAVIRANMAELNPDGLEDLPVEMHPRLRSAQACLESTRSIVKLASECGVLLHVAHLSTAAELSLFASGPLLSKRVTAETCPQYLLFSDDDYRGLGARMKCNPAVKGASDREALRRAVAEGLIDTIATDHAPHLLSDKEGGALKAKSGMPMVQFSLVKMLDLFPVELVVEKMCHNPARLFGIEERGFVDVGFAADLVIVSRLEHPNRISDGEVVSRCGWTPLDGVETSHRVELTMVNGQVCYDRRGGVTPADDNRSGAALRFNPGRR